MDALWESRQFDFWLGSWKVFDPSGRLVGTNRVTRLFESGGLLEEWEGNGGVSGRSMNSYDAGRGRWHQTWMDSTGSTLLLDGGLVDGAMVLEGSAPTETPGEPWARHRITWTPMPEYGGVRQLWETSADDGGTWSVAFDGRYQPCRRAIAS